MEMVFVGTVAVLGLGFGAWAAGVAVVGWLVRPSEADQEPPERYTVV